MRVLLLPMMDNHHLAFNLAVAAALRAERVKTRTKVETLAARTGVPYRSLMRYLNGQRAISVNVLDTLAGALGTTPDQITRSALTIRAKWETDQRHGLPSPLDALTQSNDESVSRTDEVG